MDDRWATHNLHLESVDAFREQDPTLRKLRRLPLVHEPGLLGILPIGSTGKEHTRTAAPKKARKVYFADPFIHHALRAWLDAGRPDARRPERSVRDERFLSVEVEATPVTHLARGFPTFYIKANGEVDAAYLRDRRIWPIEVKWTTQVRPKDLVQVRKYRNALIAGRVRGSHRWEEVPVLPAPVVLLRVARRAAG